MSTTSEYVSPLNVEDTWILQSEEEMRLHTFDWLIVNPDAGDVRFEINTIGATPSKVFQEGLFYQRWEYVDASRFLLCEYVKNVRKQQSANQGSL